MNDAIALPRMVDGLPPGVVVEIKIHVHANGAMAVHGPVHDKRWMVAALTNAIDAVRNHSAPRPIEVPAKDVSLA